MAEHNVQRDLFAVAAHKSETRWNLFSPAWSGWLSQHPILMKTPEEDSFLWGFESNMHCACTQHAFRHGSNFHRRSSNSLADELLRPGMVVDRALGGAEQGARRSARTMPSPVRSPPAIQQQD